MLLRQVFRIFTLLFGGGAVILSGQTVAEQKVFGQYRQFRWTDVDGLPQNTVSSIAQSKDGYLWFATAEGLARFDGANFTVFGAKLLQQTWAVTQTLLIDHAGALWIANRTGALTRYQNGVFTAFNATAQVGLTFQMIEDRAGNIWMPSTGSGLVRFRQGEARIFTRHDGLPANVVTSVAEDQAGRLWIGTAGGLALYENGRMRVVGKDDGFAGHSVEALCVDKSGDLWIAAGGRMVTFTRGQFQIVSGVPLAEVRSLYCDRDNRIWIGTIDQGLILLDHSKILRSLLAPRDRIESIFEDADGAIWIGTSRSGLYQLRVLPFEVFGNESGIAGGVAAILQDQSPALWLGGNTGFYRLKHNAVSKAGLPPSLYTGTIAEDVAGGIWVTDRRSAFLYRGGRLLLTIHPPFTHHVQSLLGDRQGNLWLGSDDSGVCRYRDGQFTCYKGPDADANFIMGFYQDRSGAIWIATQNGVERLTKGVLERWTTKDGLASNQPSSFYETTAGSIWIGAENGGLSRFKDGKFSKVTMDNGLFDNVAFAILADDLGNLWMPCNRGIYRAKLRELEECADGKRKIVPSFSYGVADGMLSRECQGASPAGWRALDGRLWFGTINGAVAITPEMVHSGRMPQLDIQEVYVDGHMVPGTQVLLGSKQENLEIRYTALFCTRPRQANFKVRLDGLDDDWTDMGLNRSIHYSHLSPGDYQFHVIADDGEGVWNFAGARLPISIAAPYYRTWWFLALCVLAAAVIVTFAWRMRMARLIRAREIQQRYLHRLIASQEQERKRLAGELHDSLAQRLTVVKNLALMSGRGVAGTADGNAGLIAAEAGEALREVREISYALRPYQLDYLGLKEALEDLVKKVAASGQTEFGCDFEALEDLVSKEAEVNVYRIVQESLQNILKHARAKHVEITAERNGRCAWLEITDDGVGFTPDANYAGLGLTSISERAQLLGGKLTLRSAPGKGTSLRIELSARSDEEPR